MAHTHLLLGTTGSGKTHTLQRLAADPTTTTRAIEPARHATLTTVADLCADFDDAEQILDQVLDLARRRAQACVATGSEAHTPTEDQPRILLLIGEADHLLRRQPGLADRLQEIVTTGRPLAIETAVAASNLFLDVWPLDLRAQLLAGDITIHGTPDRHSGDLLRERIADGTATLLPHHTRSRTADSAGFGG
ncbi:ATP-binding protein [Streptomyces sp. BE20]|uniref:ATP-binding protein n=1 Tax=Streptomyces sp. BE20 TaxID=3002525 RepID=UPI002E78547A|nr:ATP-binding protein [Streptomyces sp. BE20]MEE1821223.1 ATP-binding protein [Streptomyces sp. BE20]